MNIGGGEAADQMVRMMLSGTEVAVRLSGSALKNMLALSLALARSHKTLYGRINLGKMLRETRDLRQFPMTPEQYRQFQKLAKKQKLLYSAIRDQDDRGKLIDVILPVTELDRANPIFQRIAYQEDPARQTPEKEKQAVSAPVRGQTERQAPQREQTPKSRQDGPVAQRQADAPKKGYRSERDLSATRTSSSTLRESKASGTTSERPSVEGRLQAYRKQLDQKSAPAKQKTKVKSRPKTK